MFGYPVLVNLERVDAPSGERERTRPAAAGLPESDQAIRLCNRVLLHAASRGATQVHVEPSERGLRIRFRVDGVLHPESELPIGLRSAVTTRFKLMAGLDVAERRTPQEGQIRGFHAGKDRGLDVRVATMPSAAGEQLVLRLFDRSHLPQDLAGLGLEAGQLARMREALQGPQGLTLVAGPAGSWTTTTLPNGWLHRQKRDLAGNCQNQKSQWCESHQKRRTTPLLSACKRC